ncbi:EndoU domain-containing protein [Alphaproteobacteria bacterium]|nr:EndoU domain-containing protein [Alphaproteobacteria bacterium]
MKFLKNINWRYVTFLLVGFVVFIYYSYASVSEHTLSSAEAEGLSARIAAYSESVNVSDYIDPNRANYILHGDRHDGGGHSYGTGKPCKSEFPANWDDEKILEEIALIAANDNLPWVKEGNGYHVVEHVTDGVRIRVVNNRERGSVVTAYPKNTPRNPCPAAANDN